METKYLKLLTMMQRLLYGNIDFSGYHPKNTYECLPDRLATNCNKLMYMILIDVEPAIVRRYIMFNSWSVEHENSNGDDAFLMLCQKYDHYGIETIKTAISKMNVNNKSRSYLAYSRFRAITRHSEIFRELLNKSLDINRTESTGTNYLIGLLNHYQVIDPNCLHVILNRRPAINVKNNRGDTALMLACKPNVVRKSAEPALLLLEAGAKISLRNNSEKTALDILLTCEITDNSRAIMDAFAKIALSGNTSFCEEVLEIAESYGMPLIESDVSEPIEDPSNVHINTDVSVEPNAKDCLICLETIEQRYALLPCGHTQFCKDCINKINNRKCPMCMQIIRSHVKLHGV